MEDPERKPSLNSFLYFKKFPSTGVTDGLRDRWYPNRNFREEGKYNPNYERLYVKNRDND